MSKLAKELKLSVKNSNKTVTENGRKAFVSTKNAVLDLFGMVGSSRGMDLTHKFLPALAEDSELAARCLLWARDVRGGAGERQQFRDLFNILASNDMNRAFQVLVKIPEVGRWDDLLAIKEPVLRRAAFDMIQTALLVDRNSLCAKWMPRKGPVAAELRNFMNLTPKQYRKIIVGLSNVVETDMCNKNWRKIDYNKVPSLAAARYQKAFLRNDRTRYAKYVEDLSNKVSGVKINAQAVYPYDVVKSVKSGVSSAADAQWEALPNYMGDANILPLVDVSGSMEWSGIPGMKLSPLIIAISLGLYASSKSQGAFKDMFLTFSQNPQLVHLKGDLSERISKMSGSEWGMNTDLMAAYRKILQHAKKCKAKQKDLPDVILVLSDMQFDDGVNKNIHAHKEMKEMFKQEGYKAPRIVYWNLNAKYDNFPVKAHTSGAALVSGFSPAIMKSVLSADLESFDPCAIMIETLMDSRYDLN